jgi:hypothetical protein
MKNSESVPKQKESQLLRRLSLSGKMAVRAYFTDASQRLLTDYKRIDKAYSKKTRVEMLLAHPIAREIMQNDGSSVYLMHSTDTEKARSIMREGLKLRKNPDNPLIPNLRSTTKMMPGKHEYGAERRIEHGLTYRYSVGSRNAKIIIRLDEQNPGTSLREDQFEGTNLLVTDDKNIKKTQDSNQPYEILPERIMGFFDLDSGAFEANPQFEERELTLVTNNNLT